MSGDPVKSTVLLPCGCFFQGREMIVDPECEEHEAEETCSCCGRTVSIDELDSKPRINSKLRRIRQREGQLVMLRRAADLGFDFDQLECRRCYGPGYLEA